MRLVKVFPGNDYSIEHLGEGGGDGAEEEHGEGHDGGDGGDEGGGQLLLLLLCPGGQVGEINPKSCGQGCTLHQSSVTFKLQRGSTEVAN